MSFVDTMIVPTGGNLGPAQQWMDYLYDPAATGPLFEAISYTSPVKGAADHMSAKAASNPLINPPADAKIHDFRDLSEDEAEELETAFAKATQQ
jgi:spermidine/putrescine-binding protein